MMLSRAVTSGTSAGNLVSLNFQTFGCVLNVSVLLGHLKIDDVKVKNRHQVIYLKFCCFQDEYIFLSILLLRVYTAVHFNGQFPGE